MKWPRAHTNSSDTAYASRRSTRLSSSTSGSNRRSANAIGSRGVNGYCLGHVENLHVDRNFGFLTARYGSRLGALQYRFVDDGRKRGGITVDDRIGQQSGGLLFRPL